MPSSKRGPLPTGPHWILVAVLVAAAPVHAQDVALQSRPDGTFLTNPLPRRIVAFVRDLDPRRPGAPQIVTVNARGESAVTRGAGALVIERFDVVSAAIPYHMRWTPPCDPRDAVSPSRFIADMQAELNALPLEQRREGRQALELAASVAQLKNDRARALTLLEHNDPVRASFEMDRWERATPESNARHRQQQFGRELEELTQEMTSMMKVYAQQAKAKYEVLVKDAKRYKELLDRTEVLIGEVSANAVNVNAFVARDAAFQRTLADAIEGETAGPAMEPQVSGSVARSCRGPAGVSDVLEVTATQADDATVMVAELSYNAGTSQPTVLRRLSGTNRWFARFSWPAEASSATIRVRALKSPRWNNVAGTVRTERPSRISLIADLRGQAATLKKMHEETSNRANGADHLKTIIVP